MGSPVLTGTGLRALGPVGATAVSAGVGCGFFVQPVSTNTALNRAQHRFLEMDFMDDARRT
jgi:hypothetical protein